MRTKKEEQKDNYRCVEILHKEHDFPFEGFEIINAMKEFAYERYNQAVRDCSESATAYIAQESVNGSKVAKVNKESILKNLKK